MCQGKAFTLLTLMYTVISTPGWVLDSSTEVSAHSCHSQCWCSCSGWASTHCGYFASMSFLMALLKHFQEISTCKGLYKKSEQFTTTHAVHLSTIFWYCSDSC